MSLEGQETMSLLRGCRANTGRRIVLALLCALACGCGGQAIPKPADSTRAVEALRSTLEAWKSGTPATDLASQDPSVHVADDDWQAGYRLTDFKLSEKNPLLGLTLRCPVVLTLQSPDGVAVEKEVLYAVATDPRISIVRQDDSN
jgi:hypothetical protein